MFVHTPRDIGQLIRDRRKAAGLTQADFAAKLGASRRWVVNLERGDAGARLDLVLAAMRQLGVTLWADGGDGTAPPNASPRKSDVDMNALIDQMLDEL